jgi:hypothetical protein
MVGASGRIRIPAPLIRVSPDGAVLGEVTRAAGFETYVFDGGDAGPPYRLDSFIAVREGNIHVGDAWQMAIETYDLAGIRLRATRILGFDLSVAESDRDSLRAAMLAQELPDFLRPTQEAMARSIPTQRPAYSGLLVDSEGFVWAAEYLHSTAISRTPRKWLVFAPSGEWLGTMALPANFDLYEAGKDYLLGRSRDADGVETVLLLALSRPE